MNKKAEEWYNAKKYGQEQYDLNEEGFWIVKGEDGSCGGVHDYPQTPILGYFKGKFIDVLTHAVGIDRFYTYGSGGSIEKFEVKEVNEEVNFILQQRRDALHLAQVELENAQKKLERAEQGLEEVGKI